MFNEGQRSLQDHEWRVHPSASRTEGPMEVIQKYLVEDLTLSVRMLRKMRGISTGITQNIRPEFSKVCPGVFCLLHDNAPAHSSDAVSEILERRGLSVLSHSPYSTDIAPANFSIFPKLNIAMNGTRFEAVSSIQQTVMRELKTAWEWAFSQAFNSLYGRYRHCDEVGWYYI
jgi:hypothetical protein